jgi:predicted SAM-dependent methyltransferase
MKKVHLGCWHRDFDGYINVDIVNLPHINYKSEINNLPFFSDNSIDYIYCSHALEYYNYDEASLALKEWYRVLKPGALLRIAVPDFDSLLNVYNKTNDLTNIIGPLYGRMDIDGVAIYHKQVYNFSRLKNQLKFIGYKEIQKYDWKKTDHSQYDDHSQAYYPHMDKECGILVSLNIECKK